MSSKSFRSWYLAALLARFGGSGPVPGTKEPAPVLRGTSCMSPSTFLGSFMTTNSLTLSEEKPMASKSLAMFSGPTGSI